MFITVVHVGESIRSVDILLTHVGMQEMETPIHHCARTGNVVVLQEILSRLTPAAIQLCCNQQSRVSSLRHVATADLSTK